MITPDYYERFVCIGEKCRHNCCRGAWDIEVDADAARRFKKIDGEFGERVRAAVNDDNIFVHVSGQCPLLNDDGLCEMVLHGEELCVICDEYPRFTEFYGDYAERGISISCEAAAKIILGNTDRVCLTGDTGVCNEELFTFINAARDNVFGILQNREEDIFLRLRRALDYSAAVQERINKNELGDFFYTPKPAKAAARDLTGYIAVLKALEMLTGEWSGILDGLYKRETAGKPHHADSIKAEQLAVYFVYRYFLKGAFDCDVLSKMKLAALSVITIIALENAFGDIEECARLYSIEVEHNEDNIDAIYDEFLFCEELSYNNILGMIR